MKKLIEKSLSKKQQRFFGIVRAAQKGTLKGETTPQVQRAASSMKEKDVKKFASTKHKGLPEKKVSKEAYGDVPFRDGRVKKYLGKSNIKNIQLTNKGKQAFKTIPDPKIFHGNKAINPDNTITNLYKSMDRMSGQSYYMNSYEPEGDEINEILMGQPGDGYLGHPKLGIKNPLAKKQIKKPLPNFKNPGINVNKVGSNLSNIRDIQNKAASDLNNSYEPKGEMVEDAKMARQSDEKLAAAHKKFSSMEQSPANSFMKKRIEREMKRRRKNIKMNTEAANPAQQAAIALAKKEREESKLVARKKEKSTNEAAGDPKGLIPTDKIEIKYDSNKGFDINDIRKRINQGRTVIKTIKDIKDKGIKKVLSGNGDTKTKTDSVSDQITTAINNYNDLKKNEGNLHQWFKGSKSKDGKGGWVNVVTGGTCASDKPGEGTPKCVSSAKRASMTKAERLSAQRRKKKADPNQQSKSGAAKPTYVPTDKPKKKSVKEDLNRNQKPFYQKRYAGGGEGYKTIGTNKRMNSSSDRKKTGYKQSKASHRDEMKDLNPRKEGPKRNLRQSLASLNKEEFVNEKMGKFHIPKIKIVNNKKKEEKREPKKAQDAGARGRRLLQRREYASKVSGSVDNVPDDLRDHLEYTSESSCPEGQYYCHDEKKCKPIPKGMKVGKDGMLVKEAKELKKAKINFKTTKRGGKTIYHVNKNDESDAQRAMKNDPKYILGKTRVKPMKEAKSPAWQRKAGKNPSGGLNAKGVASYRAANPGSKLKTAVTTKPSKLKKGSKAANRRKSFCKRMKGMKKKLTSAKTARDPDSRINKALRKWNCSYEPELPMLEATRLKKEKGYDKGGTKKPTGTKVKDAALDSVLSDIRAKHGKGAIMRKGSNQRKKVKGEKSTSGTGKFLKMHKEKQQLKKDAKEMGYGSDTKGYVETRARYGSKENMKKGTGLGS